MLWLRSDFALKKMVDSVQLSSHPKQRGVGKQSQMLALVDHKSFVFVVVPVSCKRNDIQALPYVQLSLELCRVNLIKYVLSSFDCNC